MLENTNTKQYYPGPILNRTIDITKFLFRNPEQVKLQKTALDENGVAYDIELEYGVDYEVHKILPSDINVEDSRLTATTGQIILKDTVEVAEGEKLTAYRESALIQDVDYPRTGKFPASSHEGALDYLTMQNQEQAEALSRCIKAPISLAEFNGQLPEPQPNQALKWNEDSSALENYDIIGNFEAFKEEVNDEVDAFETEINTNISSFKTEVNRNINSFKSEVNSDITELSNEISTFESTVNSDILTFKSEVNTSINNQTAEIATFKNTVTADIVDITAVATNAETSATNAKTSAMNAETSAVSAVALATTAANDAANAVTLANTAESKASQAEEASTTAETTAASALSQIQEAVEKAEDAKATADSVTNTANEAKAIAEETLSSIQEAVEKAEDAKVAADSVVGIASSAQTTATSAQTTATEAKSTATMALQQLDEKQDTLTAGDGIAISGNIIQTINRANIDLSNLSSTGQAIIDSKQDRLTAGDNITIENNTISAKSGGLPIGTIIPVNATSNYVPDGSLPCDGTEYSKSQFSDLWNNYFTELGKSIYNINGSVNINNKGIANNFSSDNYVTTPVSFTLTPESNFYYKIRVKLYKSAEYFNGGWRCISAFYYGDLYRTNDLSLGYYCTDNSMGFNFRLKKDDNSYGNDIASLYVDGYFDEGTWVTVEYIKTGTTFTIKVTNEFGDTNEATTENIIVKTNTYTLARIGKCNDGSSDFYASGIDLSSVLIKVDNTTIFDGNKFYNLLNTCTYTEYEQDISTYGQCAKFAVDTANNKFRVPLIKDGSVIQQALTDDKLGKSYNAGLPNITGGGGSININDANKPFPDNSALYIVHQKTTSSGGSASSGSTINFDASRNNPIYGNSNTVQPNAVSLRYFVVVANGQINQSMMDWSAWASSLQGKANTDLSNLTPTGKKVIDGQWVLKFKILFTSIAIGTYTVDLSDYLPNDNYSYEILGHCHIDRSGHSSGTNTQMIVYSPSTDETPSSDMDGFIKVQADGANWQQGENQSMCVVGIDRTLTVGIYSANAREARFSAVAYRRIGTNK